MLACVNKAITSSSNAQTIGRNGEIPLRDFLNHYLPYTFRATTGHFVTPEGELSPQLDVMILDTRYPLLAHNADSSVLSMLHAVVHVMDYMSWSTCPWDEYYKQMKEERKHGGKK